MLLPTWHPTPCRAPEQVGAHASASLCKRLAAVIKDHCHRRQCLLFSRDLLGRPCRDLLGRPHGLPTKG